MQCFVCKGALLVEVHEVINSLFRKFISVELLDVQSGDLQSGSLVVKISNSVHQIVAGGHCGVIVESPSVCEHTGEQGWTQNNGDRWLRDVLLGKVRDDEGNMVHAATGVADADS